MYLAPLNYDRFFKKVFSHTHIAKAFLEDFLDVEITEITLLETAKYLTDDAAKVEIDFLRKNRLIFMLQDNIVKDEKFTKYHPWFEFAEKTRNKLNEKEDFKDYVQLDLFKDIMRIISKDNLAKEDLTYIDSEDENIKLVNRALQDERDSGFEEGYGEGIEKGMEKGIEKSVILLFKNGKTEIEISQWLEISIENVRYTIEKAKKAGLL